MTEIRLTEEQGNRLLKSIMAVRGPAETTLGNQDKAKLLMGIKAIAEIQDRLNGIAKSLMDTGEGTVYADYDKEALLRIYDNMHDAIDSLQMAKEEIYEVVFDKESPWKKK